MTKKEYLLDEALADKTAKKAIQSMLLEDEVNTRKTFNFLERFHTKTTEQTLSELLEAPMLKGKEGLPLKESIEYLFVLIAALSNRVEGYQLRTYQLMELVALNNIRLNHKVNELVLALSSGENRNIRKIARGIQADEKAFKKRLTEIQKSTSYAKWWQRRLDELKRGDSNERI